MHQDSDHPGILLDIDGVLHVGSAPIDGAVDTLQWLRSQGIPHRFITNTTTRTAESLADTLSGMGIEVSPDQLFSAVTATQRYLAQRGHRHPLLVVDDAVRESFGVDDRDPDDPDCVVIGDIGPRWDHALLGRLFQALMQGAELIAMHRNRYWQSAEGLSLDIGCYVAGLEYAAQIRATVIGKPNEAFFALAAEDMERTPAQCIMVGDDIDSDVGGAQTAGMRGLLVQTGKYRDTTLQRTAVKPDAVLPSIAALPDWLRSQQP
ncbi:TIGR01458 family HAD-type hydrolase [Algiphilus sp.]|uniref:TIGR01458 family HAD-type hydrolase n=1 Tax=Algiphilus sp. TaxID=1872431 RepID=UPI003B519576